MTMLLILQSTLCHEAKESQSTESAKMVKERHRIVRLAYRKTDDLKQNHGERWPNVVALDEVDNRAAIRSEFSC